MMTEIKRTYIGANNLQSGDQFQTDLDDMRIPDVALGLLNERCAAVHRAQHSIILRRVGGYFLGQSTEEWHQPFNKRRLAVVKAATVPVFEAGPNEQNMFFTSLAEYETFGTLEGDRANYLWEAWGIIAVIGNFSFGTANLENRTAFAKGFKATKLPSTPFAFGAHEGAAFDMRMWSQPGWQGEEVNTADPREPLPDIADMSFAENDGEYWLNWRELQYIHLLAEIEGFIAYFVTELAFGKVPSGTGGWTLKWGSTDGWRSLVNTWGTFGIMDAEKHAAEQYLWTIKVNKLFCTQLGIEFGGATIFGRGNNYGKFPEHDIKGKLYNLLMDAVVPREHVLPNPPPPPPIPVPPPPPPPPPKPPEPPSHVGFWQWLTSLPILRWLLGGRE